MCPNATAGRISEALEAGAARAGDAVPLLVSLPKDQRTPRRNAFGHRGARAACRSKVTTSYRGAGCESNALKKRSRKALIGQTGACGLGRNPGPQSQLPICFRTFGSWAMIEIGTS